ncbi:MAG: tetratricopeptide repeat protein [Flavobacteriales bacterium]|nr:tetratricopeptide repeat protein [Flavobacteriales bacterium]
MLTKPQAVSLPLVLVLINYWEGKRFNFLALKALIPFFLLSLLFGFMALQLMDDNVSEYSFLEQILLSGHACFLYLLKGIAPFELSHYMEIPLAGEIPGYYYLSALFSMLLLFVGFWFGRNNRLIGFGVGFFTVTLIFSLHLLKINSGLAYDRFTYLPYIGLFLAFIGFIKLPKKIIGNKLVYSCAILLIISFGLLANQRSRVWENDDTLWVNSIETDPSNKMGWCKRARYYTSIGLYDKALADQQKCVELSIKKADALVNRGNIYRGMGKLNTALADYSEAIKQEPNYSLAYSCRGVLLFQSGNKEGIEDLKKAIEFDPSSSSHQVNLGLAYELNREFKISIELYSKAIELNPYDYLAWKYRGSLLLLMGNTKQAISDLEKAISLRPDFGEAWYNLSKANDKINKVVLAKKQLEKAILLGAKVDDEDREKLN